MHLYCTGSGSPTVFIAGGYSFDWALVQPLVAKFTRVCTYDTAGTAWSDPGPNSTCIDRVSEIRGLLAEAAITKPFIFVGFSIGGLLARRYASLYLAEVAGMVLVDHAFLPDDQVPDVRKDSTGADRAPVLIKKTPIVFSTEDSSNFENLPADAKKLHRWAESIGSKQHAGLAAKDCELELQEAKLASHPLGSMPLRVVSTANDATGYAQLQRTLLSLSSNSRQMVTYNSFHSIEIDDPQMVFAAIKEVVDTVRTTRK